ncbi:MAG TPA: hypothetical protein VFB07_10515 [Vicinamibacterales bacterium]|nr:hypothetical protein [Vicinamibacterales bacterium]
MTQRGKIIFVAVIVLVGVAGTLLGFRLRDRVLPPPIRLEVDFDGGYVFDLDNDPNAVDVYALTKAHYPMKVYVGPTGSMIDLEGYALAFLPDGAAPSSSKPAIPPDDETRVNCNTDPNDPMNDIKNSNNRLFIPNLVDVGKRMGTTVKNPLDVAASLQLTGGGRLYVDVLAGCVEYRDPEGHQIPGSQPRSMASGISGIVFEWPHAAWNKIVLQRTPLKGGTPLLTDVAPDKNGEIRLMISSFQLPTGVPPPLPYRIEHFKEHFDDAFGTVDEKKRISLWFLRNYLTSPGIDCPGGGV